MPDALFQPFPMTGAARAHIWRYAPQNRRPRHFHSEPELNLIAAGTGRFGMGESVMTVAAGDLLWWPPGQDHVLLEASSDFDLFVIGMTPALSGQVLGAGGGASPEAAAGLGPIRVPLPVASFNRLRGLCAAPLDDRDASIVERHVGDFWREAHALRRSIPQMHTLTRRTVSALMRRPDLRRTDVAQLVRSDPAEVSRHFHRDMGSTLTAYRTRLRLLRFIAAADDGADSLLSAALAAGFGSYSQCHRAFHRTFGHTPRDFFATSVRHEMGDVFAPW